jgi:hypothetical protein
MEITPKFREASHINIDGIFPLAFQGESILKKFKYFLLEVRIRCNDEASECSTIEFGCEFDAFVCFVWFADFIFFHCSLILLFLLIFL